MVLFLTMGVFFLTGFAACYVVLMPILQTRVERRALRLAEAYYRAALSAKDYQIAGLEAACNFRSGAYMGGVEDAVVEADPENAATGEPAPGMRVLRGRE